jgi:hypothetical protein
MSPAIHRAYERGGIHEIGSSRFANQHLGFAAQVCVGVSRSDADLGGGRFGAVMALNLL